ncbi:MAG: 50S ribosomal protein L6 [Candidatus Dormiibacterota bacterium]
MSRIGKLPIAIPAGVKVDITRNFVKVDGPKGSLERLLPPAIGVAMEDGTVVCTRPTESGEHRSLHGLTRSLVANMVTGVSAGYRKDLELVGVGYRAQKQGNDLNLSLGFSHPIKVLPPPGIAFELTDPTHFAITGISKELVGQTAADVRKLRPPEPYKGKGIRYRDERVRRKAGKAGKGAR